MPIPCDCCPTGPPLCATGEADPVFPCRRSNGTLEWYDLAGAPVPGSRIYNCNAPLLVPQITMAETALGDDAGLGERICNVVPPVSSSSGYTVLAGPCYDGSAGADVLNWDGPLSSLSMSYESGGNPGSGAALIRFSAPSIGTVTWPANGAPSQDGGANIRIGPAAVQAYTPYHFRIDFWAP